MYNTVKEFVQNCDRCQRNNATLTTTPALHPISVNTTLFDRWGIDLAGPYRTSSKGNKFVVIATEYLTRWVEAAAIPNKSALQIAAFFKELVCRFGVMNFLQSDQGTEFCNAIVDNLEKMLGFKHKVSAAYHPQTNGLVERTVQTVKQRIRKCVAEKKDEWDKQLPFVLLSVRTSVQSSLKKSPFELLYGTSVRLEGNRQNLEVVSEKHIKRRIQVIEEALDATRKKAVKNLKQAQEKQKKAYDNKRSFTKFKVGDLVLRRNFFQRTRKGAKDEDAWEGPFKVTKTTEHGAYFLEKDGKRLRKAWNGSALKKYQNVIELD